MEEKNQIIVGNITTIIKFVSLMLSGAIFGMISAFGLKLPFDNYTLAGIIGLIIGAVFSYVDAKYQNTFFNKNADTLTIDVAGLTDNQITAINNFIENAVETNIQYDIDPASRYEEE